MEREPCGNLSQSLLICGLPDDIAISCLARVPRKYHALLKCVSKRWKELVCSEEWHDYRRKHNLDETWIYAFCRDKFEQLSCYLLDPDQSKRGWKRIEGLPPRILKRKGIGIQVLGRKIFLLGGCGWIEDATDEVFCYDAVINAWNEAASLSTPRCFFASEVLAEKIYAIGGLGSKSSNPHSWDTYDPCTNCFRSRVDLKIVPEVEQSVVLDGKIYIRFGSSAASSHIYGVVYEPSREAWQYADSGMLSGWCGPAVVVDGTLYMLDQSSGIRLMMWQKEINEWVAIRRLSPLLTRPPCRVLAIRKRMFVIGKGLSTLSFDIENAGSMDGILVSSSVPKLTSDDDVIGCVSVAV